MSIHLQYFVMPWNFKKQEAASPGNCIGGDCPNLAAM